MCATTVCITLIISSRHCDQTSFERKTKLTLMWIPRDVCLPWCSYDQGECVVAGARYGAVAEGEARGGRLEVPAQAQALAHRRRARGAQRSVAFHILTNVASIRVPIESETDTEVGHFLAYIGEALESSKSWSENIYLFL